MVANTSARPEGYLDTIDFEPSPSIKRKRMTRPRRRLNCGQGRDFFRLAAAFANTEPTENRAAEPKLLAAKDAPADLSYSKYLQARYQERSAIFPKEPVRPLSIDDRALIIHDLIAKWQSAFGKLDPIIESLILKQINETNWLQRASQLPEPINHRGISFNSREITLLYNLAESALIKAYLSLELSCEPTNENLENAINFHSRILHFRDKELKPFVLVARMEGKDYRHLIVSARIFWSHRLQLKSLQTSNAAEPSICYFHVACKSSTEQRLDFLYWLKLDEEKQPAAGDFIQIGNSQVMPRELFSSHRLLSDSRYLKSCLPALDVPSRNFIDLVRCYLISRGV